MDTKQKILLCGDVEGKFNALFNRVSNINKKSGPFDYLFCVGNFFGINNKEFEPYKTGAKKVPIPTYILGPNSSDHVDLYPEDDSVELCNNVYCLGKRGVYTDSKGIRIAYISGISTKELSNNKYEYAGKDITELYNACVRGNASFRGIDILLTSQWPSGVVNDDPKKLSLTVNKTSDFPSWLVMKLKPRYHISGLEGIYYERAPFRCPNLGDHDTTLNIVTRFLGLARVGNVNKEKWLYALNLTPLDKMKIPELLQKTTDETDCPFNFAELDQKIFNTKPKSAGSTQYFYNTNAAEESNERKRKRQKLEFDQSKCWFCLSSPSVEKHLIITVGNSTYLALAKGGIVAEHFLICPIEHHQSCLKLPEEVLQEMNQFKEALVKFYERDGKVPVFFERNYKTSHMQLQAVPIPQKATKELKEIFIDEAQAHGLKLEVLDERNRLDQVLQPNVPFFTVELPDASTLYTRIKSSFPLNFAREVLVSGPILNMAERSDWKDCILKKDSEEVLVQKVRTDFEPYDFTNL